MEKEIIKYLNKNFQTSEYHFRQWVVIDRFSGREEEAWVLVIHICTVFGYDYPNGEVLNIINKWWLKKEKRFQIHEHRQNYIINPKHNY